MNVRWRRSGELRCELGRSLESEIGDGLTLGDLVISEGTIDNPRRSWVAAVDAIERIVNICLTQDEITTMIRLLDLLPEIENRLVLNELTGVKKDHSLESMIESFIRDQLGVEGRSWEYYLHLEGGDFYDFEDSVTVSVPLNPRDPASWRSIGWDVTSTDGKFLRVLQHVGWAIIVCAGGKATRSQVEIEAEAWAKARPSAANRVAPERKRQNDAFLNLGQNNRRRVNTSREPRHS